jgi:hypothetical protein
MLLGNQKDIEVWPERAADIRQQKIQRVERPGRPATGLFLYRHRHTVPTTKA